MSIAQQLQEQVVGASIAWQKPAYARCWMFGESIQNGKGMMLRAGIRVPNLPPSKFQILPYSSSHHERFRILALISAPSYSFLYLVFSIIMIAQNFVVAKESEVPPATTVAKPHPRDSVSSRYIPIFVSRWKIGLVLIKLFIVVRQVMRFRRIVPWYRARLAKIWRYVVVP